MNSKGWVFAERSMPCRCCGRLCGFTRWRGWGWEGHAAAAVAGGAIVHYLRATKQGALEHLDTLRFYGKQDCLELDAVRCSQPGAGGPAVFRGGTADNPVLVPGCVLHADGQAVAAGSVAAAYGRLTGDSCAVGRGERGGEGYSQARGFAAGDGWRTRFGTAAGARSAGFGWTERGDGAGGYACAFAGLEECGGGVGCRVR